MEEAVSYRCSCCSFCCLSWREFYRHRFLTHSNEFNFMMRCFVEGCSQTFRCYSTFASHLFRKHCGADLESEAKKSAHSSYVRPEENFPQTSQSEYSLVVEDELEEDICSMDLSNAVDFSSADEISDLSWVDPPPSTDVSPNSNRLSHFAALFLLNVKERYQLIQSSLNFITQQIQQMISFTIDDIAEVIHKFCSEQGASEIPLTEQLESFRNPFLHVQTEYMQNKYYRENFNLVVSFS